jgi:hypothetical protein
VLNPVVVVSVHSGIRELYLPFDWKKEQTTEPAINALMKLVNDKFCHCGSGSVAKIGGYRGFGTTTDYSTRTVNSLHHSPNFFARINCLARFGVRCV